MTDEGDQFAIGSEVVAPHAHLVEDFEQALGDDREFELGELMEWEPLHEEPALLEARLAALVVLHGVEAARARDP